MKVFEPSPNFYDFLDFIIEDYVRPFLEPWWTDRLTQWWTNQGCGINTMQWCMFVSHLFDINACLFIFAERNENI